MAKLMITRWGCPYRVRFLDGIAFDIQGGLYIGYYRPDRIDYWIGHGDPMCFLEDWQGTVLAAPTNLAFGGEDGKDLVFASFARWSLGQTRVAVPGSPLYYPTTRYKEQY